jgi:hypothetical protein
MADDKLVMCCKILAVSAVLIPGALGVQRTVEAQGIIQAGSSLAPSGTTEGAAATLRTHDMMVADELAGTYAGNTPGGTLPFRPTVSDSEYAGLKAGAAANAQFSSRAVPARRLEPPLGPPTFQGISFPGSNQNDPPNPCGCFPPDTHGAVGDFEYVQIINSEINVFDKGSGALLSALSLGSFFGTNIFAFDPRALYDSYWNRWVVTADLASGSNPNLMVAAVSTTHDAAGSWNITFIGVGTGGAFWDYPDVGMDIDAIMFTGNRFNPGFVGGTLFAVDKAFLYNGLGWSTPTYFTPSAQGTLAPPVVLDTNRVSDLVAAPPSGSTVFLYSLRDSGRMFFNTFAFVGNVAVPAYTAPPNATQPGTNQVLDTLDARFQNASGQIGGFLYQVHSVAAGPSALQWYRININSATLNSSNVYFTTGSDALFNPSVAIDFAENMYVSFSRTDAPAGVNAEVDATGKTLADLNLGVPFVNFFSSAVPLTGNFDPNFNAQRWGDYSSTSVDLFSFTPAGNNIVYVTNELSLGSRWGTWIGTIGY